MGQTLTHGVYLPDEGERNCYSGLAANWQLLDGAVGTIAEHTTALSGKAPLVHTHTKSDVTDLLNSNFIPSANNSYDLGSSSYQWNNLYAKNYYYNGVAWGLDKANEWSDTQTYSAGSYGQKILLKNTDLDLSVNGNTGLSSTYQHVISWVDKNNTIYSSIQSWASDANNTLVLRSYYRTDANTSRNLSVRFTNTATGKSIYSETNGDTDLGTSTNKWKSVWFNNLQDIPTNTVEWHNSHYRGINLISTGHFANMAALLTAIRAQNWSDIYIGDYVELTFTYEGASRTVKFYVGEIDKFYNVGNTALTTHHLVMVTGDLGVNQKMNDSNTTAGGYVGSKAHTVTLPALYAILNPLFNNAILTHREHLSNTVLSAQTVSLSLDDGNGAVTYSCNNFPVYSSGDPNTPGCATAGNWYDCNLVLMSEIEMFGSNRFASSGIDDIMCPEGQIAAFKYNRNLQTLNRTINTWLRNVNSASRFCYCLNYGAASRRDAAGTYVRLRPRFLIG